MRNFGQTMAVSTVLFLTALLGAIRQFQRPYSARETGVCKNWKNTIWPEKLTPLLNSHSIFKKFPVRFLWWVLFWWALIVCKILKFQPYTPTNIAWSSKKKIYCFIYNGTKEFCQNFKLYIFVVRKHQDLNFEIKIVGIFVKNWAIYTIL